MNVSAAINLFVKTVTREKRVPFEIAAGSTAAYSEGINYRAAIQKKSP
jgi:antitoxin component of RelBE/YafQ-DinJ toxin-antitoxin module